MIAALAEHLDELRDQVRVYEQSRRVYLAPRERARRIAALRDVIAEIERLAALDVPRETDTSRLSP